MMDIGTTELLGYAAAGLVLATFSVRSIATLRALAIVSNLLFIAYASSAALLPVLVLHALLLPLNVVRLYQASRRQTRSGRASCRLASRRSGIADRARAEPMQTQGDRRQSRARSRAAGSNPFARK